jgi:hypothetical protein
VSDDSTVTVADEDPLRIEFTISLDDELLSADLNEQGRVVSVDAHDNR